MSRQRRAGLRAQWLGRTLRQLRNDNGMTTKEVGEYLRRDDSGISRFENGLLPIAAQDVERLLDLYGVTEQTRRDAILRFSQEAWRPDWWSGYADDVPETVIDLVWIEQRASEIRWFNVAVIPGLLQTPEYARAIVREANPDADAQQSERQVELRMQRQPILTRAEPPRFVAVLGEEVLRRRVGGRAVMTAQLGYLAERATRANIELRVLPFAEGAHASHVGDFGIFVLDEPFPEIVCVDGPGGLLYLEPPRTDRLMDAYNRIAAKALSPAASTEFVTAVASELEHSDGPDTPDTQ